MKRIVATLAGSLGALALVVLIFYLAGAIWGPLFEGEDESARNFKIFLACGVAGLVLGGWLGARLGRRGSN